MNKSRKMVAVRIWDQTVIKIALIQMCLIVQICLSSQKLKKTCVVCIKLLIKDFYQKYTLTPSQ